jgi:hypothetical protein
VSVPAIDRVLERLRDRGEVKSRGKGWTCLCPAHADTNPSLGVDLGRDGCVLLCCRSRGCSTGHFLATLTPEDLDALDRILAGSGVADRVEVYAGAFEKAAARECLDEAAAIVARAESEQTSSAAPKTARTG